jgi:hypothetical protein
MNTIENLFDCIFKNIYDIKNDILTVNFDEIKRKTFEDNFLWEIISSQTIHSYETCKNYLLDTNFQYKFICKQINQFYADILFDKFNEKTNDSYAIKIMIVNNKYNMLLNAYEFNNEMLSLAAEFGHEKIYFYLKESNCIPCLHTLRSAAFSNSLEIIKDIHKTIEFLPEIIEMIFRMNYTNIIKYLFDNKIEIKKELIFYPILNANKEILKEYENYIFDDPQLFYSAILSGSMETIKWMETKFNGIHNNLILDAGHKKTGKDNLFMDDIMYTKNNKKYFAHTMNYAIQSKSLEVVRYIYKLGYGISISNFITAINESSCDILKFLVDAFNKPVPHYVICYLGMNNYCEMKKEKINIIFPLLTLNYKSSVINVKKINIYNQMISERNELTEQQYKDIDFLLNRKKLFTFDNSEIFFTNKIYVLLNVDKINIIKEENVSPVQKKIMADMLFIVGTLKQIQQFSICPSNSVIYELMELEQIGKLAHIHKLGQLDKETVINHAKTLNSNIINKFIKFF